MKNKKQALIIAGIAMALFIAVAFVFLYEPTRTQIVELTKKTDSTLPVLECDYENEDKAYELAIEKQDINTCNCIENEILNNMCIGAVTDMNLYDNALNQLDETHCANMLSEEMMDNCYSVVKSAKREGNPQQLADTYAKSHNEEAINEYEQLIAEDDSNIRNYINLARAYAEKALKEQEKGNDRQEYIIKAFQTIDLAKQLDDQDSEVYRAEAYINEIEPNLENAIALYDKSIELDENNALSYAGRGHVYRMLGILDLALEDFYKAAQLDKDNNDTHIYINICNLEYTKGNEENAIKNCKIVTESENADPVFQSTAYQTLSLIFKNNNDLNQANTYLINAITLTPNDPNIYVTFSNLKLFEKQFEEAEQYARQSIELTPTKATAHLALANALYMQEKYEQAIEVAKRGVELVDADVSLLQPGKPAVKKELNYTIAHSYKHIGQEQKQKEYEQKAENKTEDFTEEEVINIIDNK